MTRKLEEEHLVIRRLVALHSEAVEDMKRAAKSEGPGWDWLYVFAWGQAYACERALGSILEEHKIR